MITVMLSVPLLLFVIRFFIIFIGIYGNNNRNYYFSFAGSGLIVAIVLIVIVIIVCIAVGIMYFFNGKKMFSFMAAKYETQKVNSYVSLINLHIYCFNCETFVISTLFNKFIFWKTIK